MNIPSPLPIDLCLANHNRIDKVAGKFTRKNGPWDLVWHEVHPDRSSAMQREREIKNWKSSKMIRKHLLGIAPSPRISLGIPGR